MRFKRLKRGIAAVLAVSLLVNFVPSELTKAVAFHWMFCSGKNPYDLKLSELKDNYVGDIAIFNRLKGENGGEEEMFKMGKIALSYEVDTHVKNGTTVISTKCNIREGYKRWLKTDPGSDQQLYKVFKNLKASNKKFSKWIADDGPIQAAYKEAFTEGSVSSFLKPSNGELDSPMNMLRLMQFYMVTRAGKSRAFIGGWPVQINSKQDNYGYKLEGARTIQVVYSIFTGMEYAPVKKLGDVINKNNPLNKAVIGENCTQDSICGHLISDGKENWKTNKAMKEFKNQLKASGVLIYDGESLATCGSMTFEEYASRTFRKDDAAENQVNESTADTPDLSAYDSCIDTYLVASTLNAKFSDYKKQLFIICLFRYLAEYGLVFNTTKDVAEDPENRKTIFTNETPYLIMASGTDGTDGYLNYLGDDNDSTQGVGRAVTEVLKNYIDGNVFSSNSDGNKPLMNEIAETLIDKLRKNTRADVEGTAVLQQYIQFDENGVVGKAISRASDSALDASLASSINRNRNKAVSGLNTLNNIDDNYVLMFFLNLCCSSGNSDSAKINNEYAKIAGILDSTSKGKPTVEQCYNMLYSIERMKQEGEVYTKTYYAKGSTQIGNILDYCTEHLSQVKDAFYNKQFSDPARTKPVKFGLSENGRQRYSDMAEAKNTITSMGGKAYKRLHPGARNPRGEFRSDYKTWKANLKSGMTKYVEGVQHQDGFVPYALEKDKADLGEKTGAYFKNAENSLTGKGTMEEYNKKAQKKVLKWEVDTEELNETLKENFWLTLTNGVIRAVGLLMLVTGFTLTTLYIFDHVSNDEFEVVKRVTFGRMEYSFENKLRRKAIFRFLVMIVLSVLMADGSLIRWALYFVQLAYNALTVK